MGSAVNLRRLALRAYAAYAVVSLPGAVALAATLRPWEEPARIAGANPTAFLTGLAAMLILLGLAIRSGRFIWRRVRPHRS